MADCQAIEHHQQRPEMMIDLETSDSVSVLSPTSFSQDEDDATFACENIYLLPTTTAAAITRTPAVAKMSLQRRTLQSMRAESIQRRRNIIRRASIVSSISIMVLIPILLHYVSTPSDPVFITSDHDNFLLHQQLVSFNQTTVLETVSENFGAVNVNNATHNSTSGAYYGAPFSIVVQLSGEMGNHLSKLASGIGIALWLHQLYPHRPAQLRFRHQEHTTKWIAAVDHLHACVPHLAHLNASQAQEEDFPRTVEGWGINSNDPDAIAADLVRHGSSNTTTFYSNHLSVLDPYMDRYYGVFRNYFAWNTTGIQCCKDRPYPDETVIHIRHFLVEMPRKGLTKGYEELSPHDLLTQPLAHLPPPGRIALVSRYPDRLEDYVTVLTNAGYTVRVIQHQTTAQDFCFLLHSQQALIGTVRSTFFWWAAVLSNATTVYAYSIDSPAKREWAQEHQTTVIESYPFTHPDMVHKFQFPLYTATTNTTTGSKSNEAEAESGGAT